MTSPNTMDDATIEDRLRREQPTPELDRVLELALWEVVTLLGEDWEIAWNEVPDGFEGTIKLGDVRVTEVHPKSKALAQLLALLHLLKFRRAQEESK